jgi:hypothetical protein
LNLFEALAIDVLLAANVKRAAALLRITWDEAWHLMERAVIRGRAAKGNEMPKQMGVDEKAGNKRGQTPLFPSPPFYVTPNCAHLLPTGGAASR